MGIEATEGVERMVVEMWGGMMMKTMMVVAGLPQRQQRRSRMRRVFGRGRGGGARNRNETHRIAGAHKAVDVD